MSPQTGSALAEVLERHASAEGALVLSAAVDRSAPVTRWTDPEGPSDREPIVLAYSITKTMIAALIFRRVEAGRLSLDDPIGRWFPDVPDGDAIPLWRVLQHSAGLPDYGADAVYHDTLRDHPGEPWTFEDYADRTYRRGLAYPPGAGWAYSNPGYMLLRELVGRIEGRSFAQLVEDEIARPLALEETRVVETIEDLAGLTPARSERLSDPSIPVHECLHPGWVSHGVVRSRASEIVRFYEALSLGRVVASDSLARMTDLQWIGREAAPDVQPSSGCGVLGDPGHRAGSWYGHGAGGPGYNGLAMHFPDLAGSGRPVTICAFRASERDPLAETVAHDVVEALVDRL